MEGECLSLLFPFLTSRRVLSFIPCYNCGAGLRQNREKTNLAILRIYKYKQYIQSPTLFYIQCCRFEHADAATPAI